MTEVFITNIRDEIQAAKATATIRDNGSGLKVDFDLDETGRAFPCGHTILRVEGEKINAGEIMAAMHSLGIDCAILEDKICA